MPEPIMKAFSAFMDFCYVVRRADLDEDSLTEVETLIARYHHFREAFRSTGVRDNFSLPRQHSMPHYPHHIREFGAPNGLCSTITESRHITAVKKPWRRSNRYNALSQMLLINQRLDKLGALRADLVDQGFLAPSHNYPPEPFEAGLDDEGAADDEESPLGEVKLAKTYGTQISRLSYG